jgi:hypothetical protein
VRPLDMQVAVSPAPTLSVTVEGPGPLVESERELCDRVARDHGGRPVPHTPPPLTPSPPEEKFYPLHALPESAAASVRVIGWHMNGAALVDPERAPGPTPPAHPLIGALKRRLDPDGRLPPWPGA